jgi:hypothetical protein
MGALALLTLGDNPLKACPEETGGQMDSASALNLLLLWMLI